MTILTALAAVAPLLVLGVAVGLVAYIVSIIWRT